MAIHKLTITKIDKAKPKDKEYLLSDGNGLSLAINPNGAKLWTIRYTSPTIHKRRKSTIGTYPNITLELARAKTREYHGLISQGLDPIETKRDLKSQDKQDTRGLFENVVNEWLKDTKSHVTPKTRKNAKSLLINDVKPHLKHENIKDIKHSEITQALKAKYKTAPAMAEKLYTHCNDLFQWCTTHGLCETNTVLNIHKKSIVPPRTVKHHKTITESKELKRLVNALYGLGSDYTKANILKLVIHLPLRAKNLTSLKWDYIDFKEKTITIPRQEMKVKDPNLDDFTLPLTDEAISIFTNQRESTLSKKYIFSSDRHPNAHINEATLNNALKDLHFDIRLHGFRSMYRSLANTHAKEHNTSIQAREAVLDHNSETTTQRAYTHKSDYLEELRILLDWWSGFVLELRDKKS